MRPESGCTWRRRYLRTPVSLVESDVAKELSCLIGFECEPNAQLIGERWKSAVLMRPHRRLHQRSATLAELR